MSLFYLKPPASLKIFINFILSWDKRKHFEMRYVTNIDVYVTHHFNRFLLFSPIFSDVHIEEWILLEKRLSRQYIYKILITFGGNVCGLEMQLKLLARI